MDRKVTNYLMKAYNLLETQNFQTLCFLLDWFFELHTGIYRSDFAHFTERVGEVYRTVRCSKPDDDGGDYWAMKKYRMVITFEEVEE